MGPRPLFSLSLPILYSQPSKMKLHKLTATIKKATNSAPVLKVTALPLQGVEINTSCYCGAESRLSEQ
jgi:hypothetical protein